MGRRIVAIWNPVSGRRDPLPMLRRIAAALGHRGWTFELRRTEAPGHATRLAAAVPGDTHAVLVCGGDGTTCEVVNGLPDRTVPLALLPAGTENLLGRFFRLPSDAERAAEMLVSGTPVDRDLGEANGRLFLAVGGVGFDAECVHRLHQRRRGHITYLNYVIPIARTFCEYRHPPLQVRVEGVPVFEGCGLVIFGLLARYATGLKVLARATGRDGLLDVAIFPCRSRAGLIRHAGRVLLGRHTQSPAVIYRRAQNISVNSRSSVAVELDGEPTFGLPVHARVLCRQIRLLAEVPPQEGFLTAGKTRAESDESRVRASESRGVAEVGHPNCAIYL